MDKKVFPGSVGGQNRVNRTPLTKNPFSRHDEVFHAVAPPPPPTFWTTDTGADWTDSNGDGWTVGL
jgi:hypothetical protein